MKDSIFRENVVIITGASFGIGQELALQLARKGAWLALGARNVERLEEIAQQCTRLGGRAIVIPTDVEVESQCKHLVDGTLAAYGRVDTLINNAGIGIVSKFGKFKDLSLFEKVMRVNFLGSVYCTFYALPHLKETRGRIVCVSSLRGKFPSATADGYGASKHAMAGFFSSLRVELTGSGVSVTMIYPGWVRTGISSRALKRDGNPLGRLSSHEENAMPVETCARLIIKGAEKRRREVVMTLLGRLGPWLKLIAPGLVDRIARKGSG